VSFEALALQELTATSPDFVPIIGAVIGFAKHEVNFI